MAGSTNAAIFYNYSDNVTEGTFVSNYNDYSLRHHCNFIFWDRKINAEIKIASTLPMTQKIKVRGI